MMLAANPVTGRFLVGPRGRELTGITMTPDGRTLFVNIQHPGETPGERSDPDEPMAISSWPDGPNEADRARPHWPFDASTAVCSEPDAEPGRG